MIRKLVVLGSSLLVLPCFAQQNLSDNPSAPSPWIEELEKLKTQPIAQNTQPVPASQTPSAAMRLSLKDAEEIALKSNPQISVARLNALASHQATREARSNLFPSAALDLTGVDAHDNSRITAGGLNNPIIFPRAAGGVTVSQLISDFGHTTNLFASARYQEKAQDQNAVATKEDILLAVNQAFYSTLQSAAVLRVAQQTVASRQLLADQVSALAKSKLKSDLDLSFANVNLAQAKLLLLDAENNNKAAMATLSAILGYPNLKNFTLVEDTTPLPPPTDNVTQLIADALSQRPEILALEFESQSAEKLHVAEKDQLLPTISALGAAGGAPVRDDRLLSSWYGAVGVNIQIPVFNGFLYTARSREAELRAQAAQQRLFDLRNRITRDVRTSWLNANTAYNRVNVSQQLLDQANRALDLAQTRYQLGLSSIVELSQAQLQQTQAEIGSAQATYDYRLALSVLKYQTTGI
jgi:outer membrane protein